jgi:hypothetical protein
LKRNNQATWTPRWLMRIPAVKNARFAYTWVKPGSLLVKNLSGNSTL